LSGSQPRDLVPLLEASPEAALQIGVDLDDEAA